MESIKSHIASIRQSLPPNVTLICVSKFQSVEAIRQAYDAGERDFAESRVQELLLKMDALPSDIRWHFIGHLQTNKVHALVGKVSLIQSVDSTRLLDVIQTQAQKAGCRVRVLLEVHVAHETTKSGFSPEEFLQLCTAHDWDKRYPNIQICGLMGMATFTNNTQEVQRCFKQLLTLSQSLPIPQPILSMGMSEDYPIALEEGSNMIRIGSAIFGSRHP